MNALALRGDEGRDRLRKVVGRSQYPVIRECPNGETRRFIRHLLLNKIGRRSEPCELKHLSNKRKRNQRDSVSSGERTRVWPVFKH